jgi:hypothetical protein
MSFRDNAELDALEADIDRLDAEHVDAEQRAGDVASGETACELAGAEAMIARVRRELYKERYFKAARAARRSECRVHGEAILVSCAECAERNPQTAKAHREYLDRVRANEADESGTEMVVDFARTLAAVEEGRAHNVEPRTTLRILEASRRTGT